LCNRAPSSLQTPKSAAALISCCSWCITYKKGLSNGRHGCFGRVWYDQIQPTVVTRAEPHNLELVHPTQNRVVTIRENARCQVRESRQPSLLALAWFNAQSTGRQEMHVIISYHPNTTNGALAAACAAAGYCYQGVAADPSRASLCLAISCVHEVTSAACAAAAAAYVGDAAAVPLHGLPDFHVLVGLAVFCHHM
jgi:hypothetical protein